MKITSLELPGLKLIEPVLHGDQRGFFVERYRVDAFREHGIPTEYAQDNHSRSGPGVLRGLHYQWDPPQGKLIGVIRGKIWDVVVDIRADSPTYGKSLGIELSDENACAIWVPAGFAHGFCVTSDGPSDVYYKVTGLYNPKTESGIAWNDPELGVKWPVRNPEVSQRDKNQKSFAEYRGNPLPWHA
ncbi:MAG: dTDP-4-dehydrorhamnose 3,5-epimerase [Bdellovibrionota bacterium]